MKTKGFTLIELLVVVSIIALLSSIILASLSNAKKNAQDARAFIDARTLQIAVELYYTDNGDWPPANGSEKFNSSSDDSIGQWRELGVMLGNYLPSIPYPPFASVVDPISKLVSTGYFYAKGTAANPIKVAISNSATNLFVTCVILNDGYYIDFIPQQRQSRITLGDGGVDPDGLDFMGGNYTLSSDQADCH